MDQDDIEELRDWLFNVPLGMKKQISLETGYPYHSLTKFGDGRIRQPKLEKINILIQYRKKHRNKR